MRSPRYSLEPLAQLRGRKVDEAARAHAASVRKREAASSARSAVEAQRARHEEGASAVREAESGALARGELHAADLARASSWGALVKEQKRSLDAAVDRAADSEKQASDAERAARAHVATRQADAEVVAKDRARWDRERREGMQARDEEALSEACRLKR